MTQDEARATEAARLAALHNLGKPAEARCWTDVAAENKQLRAALELALEYWAHRQQRYKNRHPAWVQAARAALEGDR